MNIFKSLSKNSQLLFFHFSYWGLRLVVISLAITPIKGLFSDFFANRVIQEKLWSESDFNALFEFIFYGLSNNLTYISMILLICLALFIILDSFFDLGFLSLYEDKNQGFYNYHSAFMFKIIGLKLILFLPFILLLSINFIFIFLITDKLNFQIPLILSLSIPFFLLILFFFRWSDNAKCHLVKQQSIWISIRKGFAGIFSQFILALAHYIAISGLFVLCIILYISIDSSISVIDNVTLIVVISLQQAIILIKQFIRYVLFGLAIDSCEIKNHKKMESELVDNIDAENSSMDLNF